MATFAEALRDVVRGGFCNFLSAGAQFNDFYNRLPDFSDPLSRQNWFRGAYRYHCDRVPPPIPDPVFPEGQCPVRYGYNIFWEVSINNQPFIPVSREAGCGVGESGIFGPISNFRLVTEDDRVYYAIDHNTSEGNRITTQVSDSYNASFSVLQGGQFTPFRCDGEPDNCGIPQPVPPPTDYNIIDVDIVYEDNNGVQITLPTRLEFTIPVIKNDFSVNIPVRVEFNEPLIEIPVRFTANFNLTTGDITFNIGGDLGADDRGSDNPTNVDDDGDADPPPPDSNSPDEPPPDDVTQERVISGVLCTTGDEGDRVSVIFGDSFSPDLYVPRMAWVYFRVRTGRSSTAWLEPIPVTLKRQFVPCPWENGAISFTVFKPNGADTVGRPIYKLIDVTGDPIV